MQNEARHRIAERPSLYSVIAFLSECITHPGNEPRITRSGPRTLCSGMLIGLLSHLESGAEPAGGRTRCDSGYPPKDRQPLVIRPTSVANAIAK